VRTPWINLSLIAANVLVFLYELSLGARIEPFLDRWGVVPARVSAALAGAAEPAVLWTLLTAMFLHAGWLHIGGNLLFLWIFGDNVEDRLGHALYLLFYLACGVAANLVQVYVDPASRIAAIGASGAIAGVLGAYAFTFPGASVSVILPIFLFFWVVDVPALIMIGIWFVSQFFSGIASLADASSPAGGVAWWAHVGGFIAGVLLMLLLPKQPPVPLRAGSVSFDRRAREDTGLVGLAIGTVSLVSELVQLAILARVVVVFLGVRAMGAILPVTIELVRLTNPLVAPFTRFLPALQVGGHFVELYSIVALAVFYLLGAALSWIVAAIAYEPRRRYTRRWTGRSGLQGS
jgi:membrane associated rhomboid family serine protease